jgi:VanZ family protein
MNERIGTPLSDRHKLRWFIWFIYTAAWTTALLTPHPVYVANAVLPKEHKVYAFKSLHIAGYAVLTILTGLLKVPLSWRWLLVCFLSVHAFGTEFFQQFVPERYSSWTDVGWDHIGIVLGLIVSWRWWTKSS